MNDGLNSNDLAGDLLPGDGSDQLGGESDVVEGQTVDGEAPVLEEALEDVNADSGVDPDNPVSVEEPVVYSEESPLPVMIVEQEPQLMAISGTAYNGSISTTYLEYAKGIIAKFPAGVEYVFYRVDDRNYRLLYGKDLSYENGYFGGSADYVNIYNYDGVHVTNGSDSVRLSAGDAMLYSTLGDFPLLESGVTRYEGQTLLFVAVFFVLLFVLRPVCRLFSRKS